MKKKNRVEFGEIFYVSLLRILSNLKVFFFLLTVFYHCATVSLSCFAYNIEDSICSVRDKVLSFLLTKLLSLHILDIITTLI